MAYQLSDPGSSQGFKAADHIGTLCLFIGCKLETNVATSYGTSSAVRVQLVVPLDGDHAGEIYEDSLIFGKVLVTNLAGDDLVSDIVAGRLGQGKAKAGQNPPYILERPTEEEKATILAWLTDNVVQAEDGTYSIKDGEPF